MGVKKRVGFGSTRPDQNLSRFRSASTIAMFTTLLCCTVNPDLSTGSVIIDYNITMSRRISHALGNISATIFSCRPGDNLFSRSRPRESCKRDKLFSPHVLLGREQWRQIAHNKWRPKCHETRRESMYPTPNCLPKGM